MSEHDWLRAQLLAMQDEDGWPGWPRGVAALDAVVAERDALRAEVARLKEKEESFTVVSGNISYPVRIHFSPPAPEAPRLGTPNSPPVETVRTPCAGCGHAQHVSGQCPGCECRAHSFALGAPPECECGYPKEKHWQCAEGWLMCPWADDKYRPARKP